MKPNARSPAPPAHPCAGGSGQFLDHVERTFPSPDAEVVVRAYRWAERTVGDGLADHLRLASLLLEQHTDPVVTAAALLAPLRQQDRMSPEEIAKHFGSEIGDLIEQAHANDRLRTDTEAHQQADLKALLETLADDIRVVILRLGLRLAALERATAEGGEHRDIARETLELYVPLARRMSTGILCARLEDASFRLLEPTVYADLARAVEPIRVEDAACVELLKEGVCSLLERNQIDAEVTGRTKGLYSLHRKMVRRGCSHREILDKVGLRVVVPSVQECYRVLGLLHTHFRPLPGSFKDYIGLPKDNGYQSLHTCVYPVPGISHKPVEFQIRTTVMHREAEYGVAAHWLYKSADQARSAGDEQLHWLRGLQTQRDEADSHGEFLERLRRQVYDGRLVVFIPGGRQLRLHPGATVRDLVERLGLPVRGDQRVRVNGARRTIDHPLHDGDTVDCSELELDTLSDDNHQTEVMQNS